MSELDELRELYPNLRLIPDDVLSGYHLETDADAYQLHQLYDVLGLEISKHPAYPALLRR